MTNFQRLIVCSILATSFLTMAGCSTYSGPGASIKKSAVYDAQDSAFRRMSR